MFLLSPHLDEHGIMVQPLARQDVPVVESRRIAAKMPLADHAGVVPSLLKILRERWLAAIETVKDWYAVDVRILAGQDSGTAGSADRISYETVAKAHPALGDAVD